MTMQIGGVNKAAEMGHRMLQQSERVRDPAQQSRGDSGRIQGSEQDLNEISEVAIELNSLVKRVEMLAESARIPPTLANVTQEDARGVRTTGQAKLTSRQVEISQREEPADQEQSTRLEADGLSGEGIFNEINNVSEEGALRLLQQASETGEEEVMPDSVQVLENLEKLTEQYKVTVELIQEMSDQSLREIMMNRLHTLFDEKLSEMGLGFLRPGADLPEVSSVEDRRQSPTELVDGARGEQKETTVSAIPLSGMSVSQTGPSAT